MCVVLSLNLVQIVHGRGERGGLCLVCCKESEVQCVSCCYSILYLVQILQVGRGGGVVLYLVKNQQISVYHAVTQSCILYRFCKEGGLVSCKESAVQCVSCCHSILYLVQIL